jgi:hypothetical protein
MGHPKIGLLALTLMCALTACKSPPAPTVDVFGLWPEQPPLRYKPFNIWTGGGGFVWPQLDSAKLLLGWESFPRPADVMADTNGVFAKFKSVTYDLRIWRGESENQVSGVLAYARDALPNPFHQVEAPLPHSSWYFWSLRARFELNGQTRVTEWSHIGHPQQATNSIPQDGGIIYPDSRCFRFYVR